MRSWTFFFFSLCAGINILNALVNIELEIITVKVGDTYLNMTKEVFATPSDCSSCNPNLAFLNLHENENTSVVAVRSFLLTNGGSLVKFDKGHTRTVSFSIGSSKYTVDPNRIFTTEGIHDTLVTYSHYSDEAAEQAEILANKILEIYDFDSQTVVLAIHNNAGTYGADDYLPGGTYDQDASAVHIEEGTNPSDFYYVVDPANYNKLANDGYNVVLQDNSTVTNDGSLSYYCGLKQKPYVNFESVAEYSDDGHQVVIQLDMVYEVRSIVASLFQ